ncbi:biotinidase-like isoform X2 [Archocentrus centrarchus]|uniref:biotinidase-like isoform X2 n=1 Tax=Archocentrus centrarchus TaxID=63155 RepID=UPI0011EA33BE|nr:biotinidase-like isoform X2 [Archocentrus centrarchus]
MLCNTCRRTWISTRSRQPGRPSRVLRSWCFQKMVFMDLTSLGQPSLVTWKPFPTPSRRAGTRAQSLADTTTPRFTVRYLHLVLQRLSCIARRNNIYLVANMPDLQPCPLKTSPSSSCPPDGRWQFNTNVAFRSDGLLVARYHKQNLYFEESFDTPPELEVITFDTPFAGKFGLFTCFDILFHDPAVVLVERGVRHLIFPTAWMNQLPLLDSIQFQQAFSLGANVTLLAANIRNDRLIMTGSGIYTPFSATYHHAGNGDSEEGRLLVARVPVLEPLGVKHNTAKEEGAGGGQSTSSVATDSGYCYQDNCDNPPDSGPSSYPTFLSSMMYDPFTFVLLNETEGDIKVCNGTFCCHLQYRWLLQDHKELYALGAFAGTHTVNGRYAVQVCAVVRCAELYQSSCGQIVEEAESKMDFLLEGNFDTKYVYPSILTSRMILEQPENLEKAADGRVTMKHSNMKAGLVTACLYGRMYHLDNE